MLLNIHCPALNRKSVAQRRTNNAKIAVLSCPFVVGTKKDPTKKKRSKTRDDLNKGNLGPPMGDKFRDDKQP